MEAKRESILLTISNGVVMMEVKNLTKDDAASILWMAIESLVNGTDTAEEAKDILKQIGGYRDI